MSVWIIITEPDQLPPLVGAAQATGADIDVVAVGTDELAQTASCSGVNRVHWITTEPEVPPEAYAGTVAELAGRADAKVWLSGAAPSARALLGAAAVGAGAGLVGGGVRIALDADAVVIERNAIDGAVIETVTAAGPVAVVWDSNEGTPMATAAPAPIETVPADPAWPVKRDSVEEAAAPSGLLTAERVVGVGRGVKARADLEPIEDLAGALGAEMACSMPLADDFHWYPEERYVGRSGQKIAPLLYLALGVSGEPQHMEGVRGVKVVAAINNNPDATIFRSATYGIVGDLYELVPALKRALEQN
ncbi:MAG: electron transfer flavoprotein subunit alpha/FixB family protein [Bifidobacteriaceae bacterium]|jgi:electron transfer flavoprotein alpha subunit|nr:electron transfer flavoprotein subunit alpha/FixB family protein [Bifidobacteriaceae bacterium]